MKFKQRKREISEIPDPLVSCNVQEETLLVLVKERQWYKVFSVSVTLFLALYMLCATANKISNQCGVSFAVFLADPFGFSVSILRDLLLLL